MTAVEHLDKLDELIVAHTKAPVTVTLRNQLTVAREQVEALQAEYFELKNKHAVLKNQSEEEIKCLKEENANNAEAKMSGKSSQVALAADAIRILQILLAAENEDENAELSTDDICAAAKMKKSAVLYHLEILCGMEFIQVSSDFDGGYYIMPRGRAFIIENGLG